MRIRIVALCVLAVACSSKSKTGSTNGVGNFESAALVIGQPDFTSNAAPASASATTTDAPLGSGAFTGTALFLPDSYTNRVLGFQAVPTTNAPAASSILGQASATANTPGTTESTWYLPQSVHTDGESLVIAEAGNHRVLIMPASATSAAVIVGWPDSSTPSQGCAADRLSSPASGFIAAGKLFVADRGNNRVLIWNTVPAASGAPADLVLGQSSATSCVRNDSLRNGTVGLRSASTLSEPSDVWSDGTRVMVVDRGNNRVLVWSAMPAQNGAAADLVIGQSSFTLARDAASASVLAKPQALAYAGDKLFIADAGHNRVLVWNTLPTASGAAADRVLGQSDFTHVSANDDSQANVAGTAPTARTLDFPSGVALAGSALVVSDTLNRRFLVFQL